MRAGVPKEIKDHEDRVGLVPSSVAELVHHGHEVLVERGAGVGAGLGDDQYTAAGARIVGSAGLHPVGPALRRRHAMGIGISVASDWQRRGVGSRLMEALLDAADRWLGCLRIELQVYTDNLPAIALYRKFGFELEGTHRAYALRDGRYVDTHAMARLHPDPPRVGA